MSSLIKVSCELRLLLKIFIPKLLLWTDTCKIVDRFLIMGGMGVLHVAVPRTFDIKP
jgi:hypothetical protein